MVFRLKSIVMQRCKGVWKTGIWGYLKVVFAKDAQELKETKVLKGVGILRVIAKNSRPSAFIC